MSGYTLGIDTSCYTTSLAIVNEKGELVCENRKMLQVKEGARGLRQSEGFFQHVMNLPDLLEKLSKEVDMNKLGCIAVSTRPRNQQGSYMPVFSAGERFAKSLATALKVPVFTTTHQDGHIMASAKSTGFDYTQKHISVHLSGGTSETLLARWKQGEFEVDIVGGTLDISAGQLIDRVGVAMGIPFPCGKTIDSLWKNANKALEFPVSVKGSYYNLSGSEAYGQKYIQGQETNEDIALGILKSIEKALSKSLIVACKDQNVDQVLMAGGVSSSEYLKQAMPVSLKREGITIHFCPPSFARDNAMGVAWLGHISAKGRGESET